MHEHYRRLFDLAHLFLPTFLEANKEVLGDRKGIYLAIRSNNMALMTDTIYGEVIGVLPPDKLEEKKTFAHEKVTRMKVNNEFCSFESENEEQKQYGGGICTIHFYLAPSGFPPHLDQKFALMLCMIAGEIKFHDVQYILELSYMRTQYWKKKNGEPTLVG